jgi:hypothetical protein
VLETLVGSYIGKNIRRPELGETVVAWSKQGTETWQLVTPGKRVVPYNDVAWAEYEKERNAHYDVINTKKRAELRAKSDPYWAKRREAAKAWLAKTEPVQARSCPKTSLGNEIDHFIATRIAGVKAQDSHKGSLDYFKDIQPILEAKCTECHRGAKAKGDLKLDSLADAAAAIKPGHPDASELIARITSDDEDEIMPPKGKPLTSNEITLLTQWIKEGAHWPDIRADHLTLTPLADDLTFLRRVYIDTVGVPPSLEEIVSFRPMPQKALSSQRSVLSQKGKN